VSYLLGRRALRVSTVVRKVGALKRLAEWVGSFLVASAGAEGSKNIALAAYRDYLAMLGLENY